MCLLNADFDGDDRKKPCCIKSFDEISAEKLIQSGLSWPLSPFEVRTLHGSQHYKLHSSRLSNVRATTTQHNGTRNKHMSPKQTHEASKTHLVICAQALFSAFLLGRSVFWGGEEKGRSLGVFFLG